MGLSTSTRYSVHRTCLYLYSSTIVHCRRCLVPHTLLERRARVFLLPKAIYNLVICSTGCTPLLLCVSFKPLKRLFGNPPSSVTTILGRTVLIHKRGLPKAKSLRAESSDEVLEFGFNIHQVQKQNKNTVSTKVLFIR